MGFRSSPCWSSYNIFTNSLWSVKIPWWVSESGMLLEAVLKWMYLSSAVTFVSLLSVQNPNVGREDGNILARILACSYHFWLDNCLEYTSKSFRMYFENSSGILTQTFSNGPWLFMAHFWGELCILSCLNKKIAINITAISLFIFSWLIKSFSST